MTHVLVPLAAGFEEIEAVTIIDVLRRADIKVTTASLSEGAVTGSHGITLMADTTLDDALTRDYDLIALPGGLPGADHLDNDPRIIDALQKLSAKGKPVAAICAAPKVLNSAGLLSGRSATSYPGVLDGNDIDYRDESVVIDNNIITSMGPSTALDFALTLVEQLEGAQKRLELEEQMLVTAQS